MTADWAIMLKACLRHDAAPARNRAAPTSLKAERSPKGDSVSENLNLTVYLRQQSRFFRNIAPISVTVTVTTVTQNGCSSVVVMVSD